MFNVDEIFTLQFTPLVVAPSIPKPACKMKTPTHFTLAQASPHSQSVVAANYLPVNPLISNATSFSSSALRDFTLFIGLDSNSSTPLSVAVSSSQKLLLKIQLPTSEGPSWADEVAAEQSQRSTQETVVSNCVYSGRVQTPQPRSQPLVCPSPQKQTPRTIISDFTPQYDSPALPALRP